VNLSWPRVAGKRFRPKVVLGVLLLAAATSADAAQVEAYLGEPFGVGVVTVDVVAGGPVVPNDDDRFGVEAQDGRVLYPVLKDRAVRRLIRRLLEIETPVSTTTYFLFRGEGPLELKTYSPGVERLVVNPVADPRGHARLLAEWRAAYVERWKQLRQDPQFPPVVENFLAANLARRLGFALPEPETGWLAMFAPKRTAWDDLFASERAQLIADQQLLAGGSNDAGALAPLPTQLPWPDLPPAPADAAKPPGKVIVEPLAEHVPAECFYLRFGNFPNYLWFRDLNKKWSGDLGNMLARRGIERAASKRIEQQLSLRENALAKILGPQVIADVAIVGLDVQTNLGAAVGVLFQAKNNLLLGNDLNNQRRESLAKFPAAKETTVKLSGRDVSLISSPGGEVRSYYAVDGEFHLVTTSRRLAERFLAAGAGEKSLARSEGFLGARRALPADRQDAIFAYVSPEFIREQTSPARWIESRRRMRSLREMKLVELARLQASAEGVAAVDLPDLVAAGMLPASFAQRSDGSQLELGDLATFEFSDSVRGKPGLYVPAPDMPAELATAEEAAAYRSFADRFQQEVGQTPPIAVAVQRVKREGGDGESLVADVFAGPLEGVKLGKLPDLLGEPSVERIAAVPGDLIRGEAVLDSPLPFGAGAKEPHHVFFGVRDYRSLLVARQGKLESGGSTPELMRFYLGAWPKPGILRLLAGQRVAEGPEPVPGVDQVWQARDQDNLVLCFQRELLRELLPQLHVEQVERPASAWLDVADLRGTELSHTINALGYQRARETTVSACRLMNALSSQLHVPPERCREVGERLMDGRFVSALGGDYELKASDEGRSLWTSTATAEANQFLLTAPPADYELSALSWFRGLSLEANFADEAITGRASIEMSESAVP
jgi:hypothetical protein